MKLSSLIAGLDVRRRDADRSDVRVCDLTEDSRTVLPGSLFVARPGVKSDGRRFIASALELGAVAILTDPGCPVPDTGPGVAWLTTPDVPTVTAVLAERFFGEPAARLALVGVTGTNGKTTVATLTYQLLNAGRKRCGLIGTVAVDDGKSVGPANMTTPPSIELSMALANMVEAGYQAAAMEVSSHSLDQRRTAALGFDVAVFTNITGDHLDYHRTFDNYLRAKSLLFASLREDALAIINADDPNAERIVERCPARVLRCGASKRPGVDCWVEAGPSAFEGTAVRLVGPWGEIAGRTRLIGDFNAMNVLQSVAAAHRVGMNPDRIASMLPRLSPPPGRLERVSPDAGAERLPFAVFVDYSHTDDAIRRALSVLRPLVADPDARLRVVFGCGGDRDATKRPRMGRAACEGADVVYVTSDNPRTEQPAAIIRDILSGIQDDSCFRVHVDPDRRRAIRRAIDEAGPGDVVLIAGKGHEDYQILPDESGGTRTIHFDDRNEARAALSLRKPAARNPGTPVVAPRTRKENLSL